VWLNVGSAVVLPEAFRSQPGHALDGMHTVSLLRHYRPTQNVVLRPRRVTPAHRPARNLLRFSVRPSSKGAYWFLGRM
jgi:hypothetical protein